MGCEIELKAHLKEDEIERILSELKTLPHSQYLGEIGKHDIYWSATEDGEPLFRTRYETSSEGKRVLFTQKPMKTKDYSTEYNVENEFETDVSEWDKILVFVKGLNLKICRIKEKNGYHFNISLNNFDLHCEILNIKYLGWFIETEICGEKLEDMDKKGAEDALYRLLDIIHISHDAVEPRGYNKMLREINHEKG